MSCKLLLVLCAVICVAGSLEAASLRGAADKNSDAVVHKLDYEGVQSNVRSARQAYPQDDSGEDSDEDDEEEDAEVQHQNAIRRQQAYEQSVDDSQEGSDEDDDDDAGEGDDDDDDYYGRRMRRDVSEAVSNNEIEGDAKPSEANEEKEESTTSETAAAAPSSPASGSSNTSVLIMIRDAIKKVTELPNTQQVATSAQQYFQLFEHFLQQTIEQVIGDDDDEDETDSTTVAAEAEKETETETESPVESQATDKVTENNDKSPETSEKETTAEHAVVPQPEKMPEAANEIKA